MCSMFPQIVSGLQTGYNRSQFGCWDSHSAFHPPQTYLSKPYVFCFLTTRGLSKVYCFPTLMIFYPNSMSFNNQLGYNLI